ncbi:MAG TPA: alpha/beta fold hydrolase [Candidatus Nanopelagicaceae bacterium]|nr:alpha/beta fold hydrolase [Candidatus Nanopelagicaceae bacterium]
MPDRDIEAAIAHWAPRFTTQGIDPSDFARVTNSIETWPEWLDAWCSNGDFHAELAKLAEFAGQTLTAGEAWGRAALSYHFAKFVWILDMAKHREATSKSIVAMGNVHRLLDPSAQRLEIPFEHGHLVGNLRRPRDVALPGLVLLLPGLDSTKEEFFNWENVFLQRGMATFSLDGPGQGETGYQMPLRPDYEVATSATIDALSRRTDIDLNRLGVAGVSMGGYYAARSASFDQRIKAAVTIGGPYDTGARFRARPEISRAAFVQYSGAGSMDEAAKIADQMTLEGLLGNLVQPLLVIFGKKDRLVPYEQAERVVREAPNAQLVMLEEGNHVCNNFPYIYKPLAGDWLAEQLANLGA